VRTRAQHAESVRNHLATSLERVEKLPMFDPQRVGVTEGLLRHAISELGYIAEAIAWLEADLTEARHG
jgi:hypothetical protein